MATNPPVVVESHEENGVTWVLSFGGYNPEEDECLELTKEQCFWLQQQIMNMDSNLFERARKNYRRFISLHDSATSESRERPFQEFFLDSKELDDLESRAIQMSDYLEYPLWKHTCLALASSAYTLNELVKDITDDVDCD